MIFQNNGKPLHEGTIQLLESVIGVRIPLEYRNFLKNTNGGIPQKRCFNFIDGSNGSVVDMFFQVNAKIKNEDLYKEWIIYRDRVLSDFLPIASDTFGNLICIALKKSYRDEIYFWDHELEADDGDIPSMDNMKQISTGFGMFIQELYEIEYS